MNLGYLPAYFDDDPDREGEWVSKALTAFQADNGLDTSGEADDATRRRSGTTTRRESIRRERYTWHLRNRGQ